MSQFFSRVYALVATIPPGKVMTYGQIAEVLDNVCSARYVGYAMHSAPKDMNLPCHRVITLDNLPCFCHTLLSHHTTTISS